MNEVNEEMPKTEKKIFGDKTFEIRVKIPLQIIDWMMRNSTSLQNLEEGEMTEEKVEKSLEVRNKLAQKMIISPKITDEYLEEDADEDDLECFMYLQERMGNVIEAKFTDLKESPSS